MKIHNYDTSLDELLDCPFCGGRPIAFLQGNEHTKTRAITVKCTSCPVSMKQRTRYGVVWLEDLMIDRWNRRIALANARGR